MCCSSRFPRPCSAPWHAKPRLSGSDAPRSSTPGGELQASEELRQAADTLTLNPASLQLRYLQTLLELGADQNSTVVFPLPLDIVGLFLNSLTRGNDAALGTAALGDGAAATHTAS